MDNQNKSAETYLKMYDVGVRDANIILLDENSPEAIEVSIKVKATADIVRLRAQTDGQISESKLAYLEGFHDRMIQAQDDEPQLHEQFEPEAQNLEGGPVGLGFIVVDFRNQ